ncbi:hypothetical protein GWI33_014844 [Rhynchophorus ferrugineus]|uniref:Uncharacterized protein n=1 Tax=Rhynchophorus ferrugineus TaxID=354439 RepID=A0A834M8P2_RHYFE|nr:hypothetical protein GWI33_014844 [Rhynchophorus ferrugineus]
MSTSKSCSNEFHSGNSPKIDGVALKIALLHKKGDINRTPEAALPKIGGKVSVLVVERPNTRRGCGRWTAAATATAPSSRSSPASRMRATSLGSCKSSQHTPWLGDGEGPPRDPRSTTLQRRGTRVSATERRTTPKNSLAPSFAISLSPSVYY